MKEYYECHITMLGKPLLIQKCCEIVNWKFSKIDGDPNLGDGVKCYATRQYNKKTSLEEIKIRLADVAAQVTRFSNSQLLRTKIELVLLDNIIKG